MTRDRWLQQLGFRFNPFEYEAADELESGDPHLDEYFISFPYFEELQGPRSSALFTQRGCGKSANRLQLERWCQRTLEKPDLPPNILAVRHDDFLTILADPSLDRHIEAILRRAVPALIHVLAEYLPNAVAGLSLYQCDALVGFVHQYSNHRDLSFQGDWAKVRERLPCVSTGTGTSPIEAPRQRYSLAAIRDLLQDAFTAQELRRFCQERSVFVDVLNDFGPNDGVAKMVDTLIDYCDKRVLWSTLLWEIQDVNPWQFDRYRYRLHTSQDLTPLELAKQFSGLAKGIGIDHVFVLVDRVDEFHGTAGQPARQADLLMPLLANVPLRGIIFFKFFLPRELLPILRQRLGPDEFREDKTLSLEVEWKDEEIARLLQTRLAAGSQGKISSFASLVEGKPADVDGQLVEFAHRSPRDLVRLCNRIFIEHTRVPTEKLYLEPDEIQTARRWFARTRARELYGDEWLAQLLRLAETPFTAKAVGQALNLAEDKTKALLKSWKEKGLVMPRDAAQPEAAPLFDIADPRARLVWEEEHL